LAAFSGGLAAAVRTVMPGMGSSVLLDSFAALIIGGLGSIKGALIGSLIIGLTSSLGVYFFPTFDLPVQFAVVAIILLLRPGGLFK
jgi:branched-chain amino acid transport system permease protein